ncbi:cytochrome c oxidase subunit II [Wenxinia marina]|uniref:Heme/copper-type cytochrome/quinol oxidase, subunit 2 n=1 Tax=Wenxinia marina DSM 24838 TaxID=1123501 RepID=A0A0D0PGC4_9RHOB|nr:cytochrome c oxidase subunit II [Wenxinia marina]KIQ70406.1 Heme/copper-type cytochrome/quinol oxidase, subunit 2 [Wenxinia marina DSM 24838]GGL53433.1 ubiquinol oxidase subunit 2 [Wenxinia marina]
MTPDRILPTCLLFFAVGAPAAAQEQGFLWAAGPVAEAQRAHFVSILWWMAVVTVPLLIGLPLILWRYRLNGGGGRYRRDWGASPLAEVAIWSVPVVVVGFLAWNLWHATLSLDPYRPLGPDPLEVQAIAAEGHFLFLYPDEGIVTVDRLLLDADRTARLKLTSVDVLRSVMVPRLAGQIYAMPGMTTELNLAAFAPGTYAGLNTQYSGPLFPEERFETEALPETNWHARIEATRDGAGPLPPDVLQRIAMGDGAEAYLAADADLFARIAAPSSHGAHR